MTIKKTIFILCAFTIILAMFFIFGHAPSTKRELSQDIAKDKIESKDNAKEKSNIYTADTIPGMAEKEFSGNDLKIVKEISKNTAYTRYQISYSSEGFNISGVMNVPQGKGPFPVIIMNHGYLEPEVYRNGDGLPRELDYFPRHGYVVLHSDYRNYALSDFDPNNEVRPRSGYVEDILNAISSIKKSNFSFLDKEKIVMFGHSMGGGIALNVMVTKPDIVRAYVLYAPINSDYAINFDRWVKTEWPETAQQFYQTYGTPENNPQFWHDISAANFLDSLQAPIQLHQGTADTEVPVEWSRDLKKKLEEKNKDITYYEYPGQPHVFNQSNDQLMLSRSLVFFNNVLK